MSDSWLTLALWLLRVTLGGGLVLLCTWLLVRRLRQPARRQRVAEWGALAALLLAVLALAPSWLLIPIAPPPEAVSASESSPPPARPQAAEEPAPAFPIEDLLAEAVPDDAQEPPIPAIPAEAIQQPPSHTDEEPVAAGFDLRPLILPTLLCVYLVGCLYFLARLGWGYVQLARFLARTRPVPEHVHHLFEEMAPDGPRPRLLMAPGLTVPLSCGVWRPAVVLPAALCELRDLPELRWVLAHELAHLRRNDARTTLLFGLARAIYFFLPWFWWLRQQTRLCQEFVADAAVVAEGGPVEEYAEFLLRWSTAPAVPTGTTGVSGHSSELFRRISMLVSNPLPVEQCCPRRWSLLAAVALLSLSIVAAGVGLSQAAPADSPKEETKNDKDVTKQNAKKEEPKKEEPKKDEPKKEEKKKPDEEIIPGFPEFDDLFKRLPGGLDDETAKMLKQQLELNRKMLEQLRKQLPGGALPQLPGGGIMPLPGGGLVPFPQIPRLNIPNLGRLNRVPARDMMAEPRMGVRLERPTPTIVDQLDLPNNQGLIIEEMRDDAPAAKAGLKKHDIILELDGKPVPSDPREFTKLVQAIKPDQAVDAVVMRKTKKETIKGLKLPKMDEQPAGKLRKGIPLNLEINPFQGGFGGLGAFNGNLNGGPGVTGITLTRTNDSFTVRSQDAGVTLSISGKVNAGKAETTEISVQEGDKTTNYQSVDKVPEAYRDRVQAMLRYAESGKVRSFRLGN
jgi:beta-lactamase regulating signal transducer with metallopeptidase domain